jgi:hypothetical protein
MTDALAMASLLRDFLVEAHAVDGGAMYQIVVTDASGNKVEVKWQHDRWMLTDRVDEVRLLSRLRLIDGAS